MSCPRLFEVEALRDGRLSGQELASFERHLQTCKECAAEAAALEKLAEAARKEAPPPGDELRARRERTRLLASFNRSSLLPETETFSSRWLGAGVIVGVGLAVLVFTRRPHPQRPIPPVPQTEIVPEGTTSWSQPAEGQIDLTSGTLKIHVQGARKVHVHLPDGELEDLGTTFSVTAAEGHTTRVSVLEGAVLLKRRGEQQVRIGAGETWTPPVVIPQPAPTPVASTPPLDPAADFRAAMHALDTGNHREAATRFATFASKHPQDPRAEDAAYLRVIALQRAADPSAMKEAAKDYVRRYPTGFRLSEVQPLTQ